MKAMLPIKIACSDQVGFHSTFKLEDGTVLPFVEGAKINIFRDSINTAELKLTVGEIEVACHADLEPLICKILRGIGQDAARKLLTELYWEWHGDDEPPVKPDTTNEQDKSGKKS